MPGELFCVITYLKGMCFFYKMSNALNFTKSKYDKRTQEYVYFKLSALDTVLCIILHTELISGYLNK